MAIIFQNSGLVSHSERMLKSAINDATIVRPLSRRAYILCDLALKCFSIGDEINGKKIFDLAIEATTNIRQYSLRDEVFDDLTLAMDILQELECELC
jgi:hypothetical protein